jgi:hypothetical protein
MSGRYTSDILARAAGVSRVTVLRYRRRGFVRDTAAGSGTSCRYTLDDVRRVVLLGHLPAAGPERYAVWADLLDCATRHSWRGWAAMLPDGTVAWAGTAEAAVGLLAVDGVTTLVHLEAIAVEADQAMRAAA